jgi:hypothetical protein
VLGSGSAWAQESLSLRVAFCCEKFVSLLVCEMGGGDWEEHGGGSFKCGRPVVVKQCAVNNAGARMGMELHGGYASNGICTQC